MSAYKKFKIPFGLKVEIDIIKAALEDAASVIEVKDKVIADQQAEIKELKEILADNPVQADVDAAQFTLNLLRTQLKQLVDAGENGRKALLSLFKLLGDNNLLPEKLKGWQPWEAFYELDAALDAAKEKTSANC